MLSHIYIYIYEEFVPNRIQVEYSKYVLGVHKSATNIAILGELGLIWDSNVSSDIYVRVCLHVTPFF
jgi:hypothetical protein